MFFFVIVLQCTNLPSPCLSSWSTRIRKNLALAKPTKFVFVVKVFKGNNNNKGGQAEPIEGSTPSIELMKKQERRN